jgi:hypothetical protein
MTSRVLRPGGRAVWLDADQETRIVSDLDPDVASAFIRASLAAVANPYDKYFLLPDLDTAKRRSDRGPGYS